MNKILVMETFGFNLYFDGKNKGRSKGRDRRPMPRWVF